MASLVSSSHSMISIHCEAACFFRLSKKPTMSSYPVYASSCSMRDSTHPKSPPTSLPPQCRQTPVGPTSTDAPQFGHETILVGSDCVPRVRMNVQYSLHDRTFSLEPATTFSPPSVPDTV